MRKIVIVLPAMILALALVPLSRGAPGTLSDRDGAIFDSWGLCRTRSWENDGFFQVDETSFRPAIVFESLGELKDKAWQIGHQMAEQYSERNQLAEQIFLYVRDHVAYTSDLDHFGVEEFAQNADELAEEIESHGAANGDCEDDAILLAVMFHASGFRSAIVLAPSHAAAVVRLPDYPKANTFWNFNDTDGWIWAEATGRTNSLGWTPTEYIRSDLAAYEVTDEAIFDDNRAGVSTPSGGTSVISFSPFLSIIFFLWLVSFLRKR